MFTQLLLLLLVQLVSTNQKFAIEPENQSILLGTKITLPCRVVDLQGVLQWTKDDFGLGTHRNLSGFERYKMIGTDNDGDYSLEIDAIELDDDAKYQCQVSPGPNGEPGIRSRYATVTVLVPPEPPIIKQGAFKLTTEDDELQLECTSNGGKPAAELTWIDGSGNVLTTGIKYVKELLPDGRRFAAKSILKMKPKKEHHNTTFTCQAQNSADRNFKTAELKMEVRYAPKIHLSIIKSESNSNNVHKNKDTMQNNSDGKYDDDYDDADEDDGSMDYDNIDIENNNNIGVREGTEVKFLCISKANPLEVTYKWFINNEFVVGDYTTEMVIHNASRSQHMAEIKCEVSNDVGESEETLELNVIYPPVFKEKPNSIEAEIGEEVALNCDADGNPLEIVWVHDPIDRLNFHPRVVGSSNELEIKVSNETAGRYFCKAIVTGYSEIKSEAFIYVKQSPIIYSPSKQYGAEGDTLRLECAAFSVPKARHISWSFMGREINTNTDHDYSILEDPSQLRGIKSTLIIRDSQSWHFGKYNCSVVNDYGTDILEIDLQHQNNFQFLMIIVGATSGVVIFVIIIVLFLCFKLKGKQDQQDDQDDDENKNYDKEKKYPVDVIPDKHKISDKCWKESDCSSHSSDYKPDIKASGSSESDYSVGSSTTNFVDSTYDIKNMRREQSLPLAGTVSHPKNYRYSFDEDRTILPKYVHNNYGYIEHNNKISNINNNNNNSNNNNINNNNNNINNNSNNNNNYNNSNNNNNNNNDNVRYCSPPTATTVTSQQHFANKIYLVPQLQYDQQQPSLIDANNYSFIDNTQYPSSSALRYNSEHGGNDFHRPSSMLV